MFQSREPKYCANYQSKCKNGSWCSTCFNYLAKIRDESSCTCCKELDLCDSCRYSDGRNYQNYKIKEVNMDLPQDDTVSCLQWKFDYRQCAVCEDPKANCCTLPSGSIIEVPTDAPSKIRTLAKKTAKAVNAFVDNLDGSAAMNELDALIEDASDYYATEELADIMASQRPGSVEESQLGEFDPTGRSNKEPGAKNDGGKTRWSLLPWEILEGIARVMTKGAAKYSDNGWQSVPDAKNRYFSAMMRHWRKIQAGEYMDDGEGGTNEPHWACFACNAVFLCAFFLKDEPKE